MSIPYTNTRQSNPDNKEQSVSIIRQIAEDIESGKYKANSISIENCQDFSCLDVAIDRKLNGRKLITIEVEYRD